MSVERSPTKGQLLRLWKVVQSISGWIDTGNPYRLSRAYVYIYVCVCVEFLAWHFNDLYYGVGDDRRTVTTSTTPHISDQLGTENACETLLCWFIVMIWALVCNDMYRYWCHFGSLYRYSTILETVLIAWVNMENLFIEIQRHEIILTLMCKMWKSNVKTYFLYPTLACQS